MFCFTDFFWLCLASGLQPHIGCFKQSAVNHGGQGCASGYLPVETLITPHSMFPSMFKFSATYSAGHIGWQLTVFLSLPLFPVFSKRFAFAVTLRAGKVHPLLLHSSSIFAKVYVRMLPFFFFWHFSVFHFFSSIFHRDAVLVGTTDYMMSSICWKCVLLCIVSKRVLFQTFVLRIELLKLGLLSLTFFFQPVCAGILPFWQFYSFIALRFSNEIFIWRWTK